ncbi:MAG: hypothetical protein AAGI91_14305 [Bacteroidota bacterium]
MRFLFLLALVAAPSVLAQPATPEAATPEDAAAQLTAAFQASDFERAASLMHPDALASLKGFVGEIVALDSSGMAAMMFVGDDDPEAIAALSPEEVFARFLGSVFGMQPEIGEALRSMEAEMIGHVMEGDSLAHVVTRSSMSMMGASVVQTDVVTTKRYGDEWRALLSGDISNLVEGIRAGFKGEK